MPAKPIKKKHLATYVPPWMIVVSVAILLVVVVLLAVQDISREKRNMSQILSEKAAALIKAFEAGARTGMMGMMWGENQVQSLLEETARQPGILYLVVTDKTGLIVAHSDRARIGQKLLDEPSMKALDVGPKERWRLMDYGDPQRSFEVYRYFRPWENTDLKMHIPEMMQRMMMGGRDDWCLPWKAAGNEKIIFVGLDVEPFETARKEDIRNTLIITSVLLLLGFGGFFSMFLAQGYRTTKRLLQDTSAFANEVVTSLPVGLIATDREGKIAFFNEAAERITRLNSRDVQGRDAEEVLPSHWCGLKPQLDRGEPVLEREMECVFSDGSRIPLSVSATRIANEEGQFVGNILILRDLGEVKRLQDEVRRKEKLAALGGLAAGIAHEIRNPLSSIKGLASFFGSKSPERSEDREAAAVMVREVDRLNRVISELLEFARPSELKPKSTDINELLEHSLRLVQGDVTAKKIEINLQKGENLPLALLDPDRFSQCLLNLYLNAIQAMDEGGALSVRSLGDGGETIRVEVGDTGKGIDPNDLDRIFDPYFTTKSSGTGLGLAIVHKVIEGHKGSIKVRSTPGKGTIFTIFIPTQNTGKETRGLDESRRENSHSRG